MWSKKGFVINTDNNMNLILNNEVIIKEEAKNPKMDQPSHRKHEIEDSKSNK